MSVKTELFDFGHNGCNFPSSHNALPIPPPTSFFPAAAAAASIVPPPFSPHPPTPTPTPGALLSHFHPAPHQQHPHVQFHSDLHNEILMKPALPTHPTHHPYRQPFPTPIFIPHSTHSFENHGRSFPTPPSSSFPFLPTPPSPLFSPHLSPHCPSLYHPPPRPIPPSLHSQFQTHPPPPLPPSLHSQFQTHPPPRPIPASLHSQFQTHHPPPPPPSLQSKLQTRDHFLHAHLQHPDPPAHPAHSSPPAHPAHSSPPHSSPPHSSLIPPTENLSTPFLTPPAPPPLGISASVSSSQVNPHVPPHMTPGAPHVSSSNNFYHHHHPDDIKPSINPHFRPPQFGFGKSIAPSSIAPSMAPSVSPSSSLSQSLLPPVSSSASLSLQNPYLHPYPLLPPNAMHHAAAEIHEIPHQRDDVSFIKAEPVSCLRDGFVQCSPKASHILPAQTQSPCLQPKSQRQINDNRHQRQQQQQQRPQLSSELYPPPQCILSANEVQITAASDAPLINLEAGILDDVFSSPLSTSKGTLSNLHIAVSHSTVDIATNDRSNYPNSSSSAPSLLSSSSSSTASISDALLTSSSSSTSSTSNTLLRSASSDSCSRKKSFEDDANSMFIDMKFLPSSPDDRGDADGETNGQKTNENQKECFESVAEGETLIKSEQAMKLAFPDSTTADDASLKSNANPLTQPRGRESALNPFDDMTAVDLDSIVDPFCPSGYAQESHNRLVADPVRIGRHHDGRPRPHDPLVCYICAEEVGGGGEAHALFDHVRALHTGVWTDSVCPLCGKQLLDKTGVVQHFDLVHLKLRPYKCDICHAWWGFAKHDVMRHKNAVHLRSTSIYECTLCTKIFHTDLNLRNHYKARHNCRIRFKGHFGPEVEQVIPLSPNGADNVIGNPNKETCLIDWNPELAGTTRKRKHAQSSSSSSSSASLSIFNNSLPMIDGNFFQVDCFKREVASFGVVGVAPPPPPPQTSTAPPNVLHNELLLYQCAECGNKYGHKELIKFHLVKKHGVSEADLTAGERLKKVLSPYNRFCKSVFESVRRNFPDLPSTEHSKIVGNMWREMNDLEKERYNDDYEAERNEMQAVADKSEKLWILKYMCTKCDAMFDSGMELGGHLTICAG